MKNSSPTLTPTITKYLDLQDYHIVDWKALLNKKSEVFYLNKSTLNSPSVLLNINLTGKFYASRDN